MKNHKVDALVDNNQLHGAISEQTPSENDDAFRQQRNELENRLSVEQKLSEKFGTINIYSQSLSIATSGLSAGGIE